MHKNIISVGQINNIEHIPINYVFRQWHHENLRFTNAYPGMISNLFFEEQLHIAPISPIDYLNNKDELELINTICISSSNSTGKPLLFSKYKLEELNNKRIAIPNTSSFSIETLKIILNENGVDSSSINWNQHKYEQQLPELLQRYDAILYNGNKSILEPMPNSSDTNVYDLSLEWKKLTNLPLVFTVWVSWKDWKNAKEDDFQWLSFLFDKAVEASLTIYFNEIVEEINTKYKWEKEQIHRFFHQRINYRLTEEHLRSIDMLYQKYRKI